MQNFEEKIKEIQSVVIQSGYKLEQFDDCEYQLFDNGYNTGVYFYVLSNEKLEFFILAFIENVLKNKPVSDNGTQSLSSKCLCPNMVSSFDSQCDKLLLYQFLLKGLYFYESAKFLSKWNCCRCGKGGTEQFLEDGSIITVDDDGEEFRLIISDSNDPDAIFDEKINEYVTPTCDQCRVESGYAIETCMEPDEKQRSIFEQCDSSL